MKGHDYILYILCAKWDNSTNEENWMKVGCEKNKHNILSF
jgi:hypothetical protein